MPLIAQNSAALMPTELRKDRLLVNFVRGYDNDGTVRRWLMVVQTDIINGHAKESRCAESDKRRILFLKRTSNRFFALINTENKLSACALRMRRKLHAASIRNCSKNGAAVSTFVRLKPHLTARTIMKSGRLVPKRGKRFIVHFAHLLRPRTGDARQIP
jgi:hypothetical protein